MKLMLKTLKWEEFTKYGITIWQATCGPITYSIKRISMSESPIYKMTFTDEIESLRSLNGTIEHQIGPLSNSISTLKDFATAYHTRFISYRQMFDCVV